ncbi:TRAP-type C4-dicarboxylate transport system substrate-binding protein [Roseibium hamelinense]|uniref:TRAP-type C4-dicarboxylate transport system substrate-binding protein n=1 Tax=Roseibium hamelinense TaxID=150831 RepID=A0A562T7S3_9HYPH|nr:TRAP transporter substrate-binding protein [Roseibium hamelinense]MTI43498.1 TRAP transporter substrate-binding protein [Roseibium hamelinense]TWI89709.1 TRAP-type C4-dicarboxylate transport system substrate-binding protein [Roseibium hamelinense]
MKRIVSLLTGAAALAVAAFPASAQDVTLTLHHFLGPKAPAHSKMLEPWARSVEEASDGRIKVEIFPAMSLGGKPPELYSQVRDGVVDIVWTVLGYTPGVFPRTEVFELPGVHGGSAEDTTVAIAESFDMIADDFKDVHPILVHVHGGQAFHMVDKPVRSPADLEGLKLRTPSRIGGWTIEAYGAEPVGMPVPDLPQALSKGVVAGAMVPFEIMRPLKLQELTQYSTEGPGGERFGTATFMIAMNKDRYDSLPDDLKKVIDDHSMSNIASTYGAVWDGSEGDGKSLRAESGELITLTEDEMAAFDAKAQEVIDRWIAEADSNGMDGAGMVKAAQESIGAQSGN